MISYRHYSIKKVVFKVFPHEKHNVYIYHIRENLKTKFKNPVIQKLFYDITHTYHILEFNVIFGQLEMIYPKATRYQMGVGVDRWTHSHYSLGKYIVSWP